MDAAMPLRAGTEIDRELNMPASFTRRVISWADPVVWVPARPQPRLRALHAREQE